MQPVIADAVADLKKAADPRPNVTEVPAAMQIGYNYTGGSRRKYNSLVDFDTLRTFSVMYDVARACINHRKRQIANLEWSIVPKDQKADAKKYAKQIEMLTNFFEEPARGQDFKIWIDKIMEDLLVLDAAVLWKDKTYGNKLLELLPIDGSTIRIRLEPDGTIPAAPEIAYEQVIYGEVKGSYTDEEMIYKIINPRNNTPYGLGPLECLIIGVDAALRSQMYNASMLSEGSVPEGFYGLPEQWKPDQIKDFQIWFDSLMAGNFQQTSRIKFMPGGKGVGYTPTKKAEDMRYLEFEKWLLVKCCALYDVQPQDIGFIENVTVNTGDTQKQIGNQRGLVPTANFIKQMLTQIIKRDFGITDLKFEWKGLTVVDSDFELTRNETMLKNGAMTINEWRVNEGLPPFEDENASKPMVYTAAGPVALEDLSIEDEPLDDTENMKPIEEQDGEDEPTPNEEKRDEATEELDELTKWESKSINHLKRGKGIPAFSATHIDKSVQNLIQARLSVAKSKEEVKAAFSIFKSDAQERSLVHRAMEVRHDISKFKRDKYEKTGRTATGAGVAH